MVVHLHLLPPPPPLGKIPFFFSFFFETLPKNVCWKQILVEKKTKMWLEKRKEQAGAELGQAQYKIG